MKIPVYTIYKDTPVFLTLDEAESYLVENYPEYCGTKDGTIDFCENMIGEDELLISETGNPTPCRDWDYSAGRSEDDGEPARGMGATPLRAAQAYCEASQ